MKRFIPTACLAAAFAVGLSAQTPSPAPAGQPPSPAPAGQPPSSAPQAQASGGKNVTVTGCLKAGDEPGSFALSNVKTAAAKDAPERDPAGHDRDDRHRRIGGRQGPRERVVREADGQPGGREPRRARRSHGPHLRRRERRSAVRWRGGR